MDQTVRDNFLIANLSPKNLGKELANMLRRPTAIEERPKLEERAVRYIEPGRP